LVANLGEAAARLLLYLACSLSYSTKKLEIRSFIVADGMTAPDIAAVQDHLALLRNNDLVPHPARNSAKSALPPMVRLPTQAI
jgi:hypothetical protein